MGINICPTVCRKLYLFSVKPTSSLWNGLENKKLIRSLEVISLHASFILIIPFSRHARKWHSCEEQPGWRGWKIPGFTYPWKAGIRSNYPHTSGTEILHSLSVVTNQLYCIKRQIICCYNTITAYGGIKIK